MITKARAVLYKQPTQPSRNIGADPFYKCQRRASYITPGVKKVTLNALDRLPGGNAPVIVGSKKLGSGLMKVPKNSKVLCELANLLNLTDKSFDLFEPANLRRFDGVPCLSAVIGR